MNIKNLQFLKATTFLLLFLLSFTTMAQRSGSISGQLRDAFNNDPLMYANIMVMGTALGAVTDEQGNFSIANLPEGTYIIEMRYIGYRTTDTIIDVAPGVNTNIGIVQLQMDMITSQEVVVTALLMGQSAAINQQVKSNTIVNVVSREKIQEVPDVNAAESIARLPGVTISRSGGEGAQVTVRGVSPRFNTITVNGQSMPSTGGENRSVNLSMISSEMLDGIEVYKAITPDMDGDAVGGSVNLVTRVADPGGWKGRAQIETGYHSVIEDLGTYRGALSVGNRFYNNKIGIVAGANYHDANRNVDFFDADYELRGDGSYRANNARFRNQLETRNRLGYNTTLDYKFKTGKIILDHFYSETTRDVITRGMRGRPSVSTINFNYNTFENNLNLNSTSLRGDVKLFNLLDINYAASRSKTQNHTPLSYGTEANQESGFLPEVDNAMPIEIFSFARINLDDLYGGEGIGFGNNKVEDENLSAQLDLSVPFRVGNFASIKVKTGGKIRQKNRTREINGFYLPDYTAYLFAFRQNFPHYERNGNLYPTSNFIDHSYTGYDSPFASYNDIPFVFDPKIMESHYKTMSSIDSLWANVVTNKFDQYDVFEKITAGYVMTEITLFNNLLFIPGFRYEETYNEYTGFTGHTRTNDTRISGTDTTATSKVGIFLPMFHLRYEFIPGVSIRLAATKTLSRPDFMNLTPFKREHRGNFNELVRGSIDLKIPTAWNYDAILTYFSRFGLVSAGVFYKEINDIDISARLIDWSGTRQTNPYYGWTVTSPINLDYTTKVYGGEMEVQTNLRFLPQPFDGIVISGNYSLIRSETYYPFFYTDYPEPDYLPVTADSVRVNRMQGQADFIANLSVGYEKRGFTGRVSLNYQGDKFAVLGASQYQDVFTDKYIRWDVTLSQKFMNRWQLLLNMVNITNEVERNYTYIKSQPTRIEQYGWQAILGLRYSF
jgi:TonB-dependent receptor